MVLFQRHHCRFEFLRLHPVSRRTRGPNAYLDPPPGAQGGSRPGVSILLGAPSTATSAPWCRSTQISPWASMLCGSSLLGAIGPPRRCSSYPFLAEAARRTPLCQGISSVKRPSVAGMLRLPILTAPVEVGPAASTFGSRRPPKARSHACSKPTAQSRGVQLAPHIFV